MVGFRALANYLATVAFALVGSRVSTALRERVFAHVQALSDRYHSVSRAGDTVQRLVSDIGRLQEGAVTAGLPDFGLRRHRKILEFRHPRRAGRRTFGRLRDEGFGCRRLLGLGAGVSSTRAAAETIWRMRTASLRARAAANTVSRWPGLVVMMAMMVARIRSPQGL